MKLAELSLERKLALLALTLGGVALFANPYRGPGVRLDTRELAQVVQTEVDHVSVDELAGWIVTGRADYRLIDLRDPKAFAEYHVPTAENVPLAELGPERVGRPEKLVLYSDGGIHAAQAWMLLRAQGYKSVYSLRGGLEEWKDQVLFPTLSASATPAERAAFERRVQLARFFGGTPRQGGVEPATVEPMPMPSAPVVVEPPASAAGGVPAARKGKKEGC